MTLRLSREDGIIRVITLDNPPVNVLNVALMADLRHLLTALKDDDSVRVIVFDSADPEFFIAHVDMSLVDTPDAFDKLAAGLPDGVNAFQALGELLRHQPQVTIVKLAGMARGGGAEFVTAADMAFSASGRAGLGQTEALNRARTRAQSVTASGGNGQRREDEGREGEGGVAVVVPSGRGGGAAGERCDTLRAGTDTPLFIVIPSALPCGLC